MLSKLSNILEMSETNDNLVDWKNTIVYIDETE